MGDKLYSKNYDDQLWINIDIERKSITFEEFMSNFIIYKDSIVTQVIHAEYNNINDVLCITHIDHEFIFYTLAATFNQMYDKLNREKKRNCIDRKFEKLEKIRVFGGVWQKAGWKNISN